MGELPCWVDDIVSILQKCKRKGHLPYAKRAHLYICNHGMEAHKTVGNYIVPMFVVCGSMPHAQQAFAKLIHPNESSWTSLMLGFAQSGKLQHTFDLYREMQENSVHPSRFTHVALLKACTRLKDLEKGRETHAQLAKKGLDRDLYVGNCLIDMYAKSGSFLEAWDVFDKLPVRDVVSWTTIIGAYTEHGTGQEALKCFEQMQLDGISPDPITFVCALKACASTGDIDKGRILHMDVLHKGFEKDPFVSSALVDMYVKCGLLSEGHEVLNKLPVRDVVSWTALISGYAEYGPWHEALKCMEQMQLEGVVPNAATYVCGLKACGSIRDIEKGRELHIEIEQKGFERDAFVRNTLIDMYAKCGLLLEARAIFDNFPGRDVVSWNAIIAGYAEHGPFQEALDCFKQMQMEGICPDKVTFISALKACGKSKVINKGREIHVDILLKKCERDLVVGSTLVDMYAKCGSLADAREVFDKLAVHDIISWNALIAGYVEYGPWQETLNCFEEMQKEGIVPDVVTFVCILRACGIMGAIDKGRDLHKDVVQHKFDSFVFVGNTLIDMYAKCGSLFEAQRVFDKLLGRDVVSWSSMINGYGMNHEADMALNCFEEMQKQGVKPNAVTFTCLLTACSRASLGAKGKEYFNVMRQECGIVPTVDHYTCIIDLLGRSGKFHEADKFLKSMIHPPSAGTWTALLSACKTHGEAELGLKCFQQLAQMNPESATSYVLMADLCASAGRLDDAYRIEELRKQVRAKKKAASAIIEVNKKVHEFMLGGNNEKEVLVMLESLNSRMKAEGHMPNLDQVLRLVSDKEKDTALCEHAEKIALAFGLLSTPPGQTLRISKNLRMCKNCHDSNKIISGLERREIIVRDGYSVHHFKDGACSCRDVL